MRRLLTSAVLLTPINRSVLKRLTLRTHVRSPSMLEMLLWSVCIFLLTNPFTFQLMGEDPSVKVLRNVATMRREEGSQNLFYVLRLGVLAIATASAFVRWRISQRALPRIYTALPFLAWASLSVVWSDSPESTIHGVIAMAPLLLSGFLISIRLAPHHSARIVIYSGALVAIFSIIWVVLLPHYGVHQVSDASQSVHVGSWRGIYLHKNQLGQTAAVYATAILLAGRTVIPNKLMKWGLFGLMLLLIVKSSSVSALAIVPLATASVILMVCMNSFQRFFALLASVFAAVFAILSLNLLLTLLGRDATFSGRTTIWDFALSSIGQRFLQGYGYMSTTYGEFTYNLSRAMGVFDPHNGFIDITLGLGLVGLILFFTPVIAGLRIARRIFRIGGAFRQGGVVLACVLTAWLFANLSEASSRPMGAVGALGFVAMGMLLALPRPRHFRILAPIELRFWEEEEATQGKALATKGNDYATP